AYRIIATTNGGNAAGAFTLAVTRIPAPKMQRLVLKDNKVSIDSELLATDSKDTVRNTGCKIFLLELEAGQACRMAPMSRAVDAFLRLEDPDGKQVAANDDGGNGTDSRIIYRAARTGTYHVIATSLGGQPGTFTLAVTRTEAPKPVRIALKDGKVTVEDNL